ncbi:hypothetical protein COLO4_32194 [Corchorus olitorius]|uniref:Uncharacterized protein n=1 Tax=Corchorus olitorius TaxID=93759 RepID=A0A1R3H0N9_9ROSI|nr:hypothetical protein COLO4_32194 [Corchorus olitorius]
MGMRGLLVSPEKGKGGDDELVRGGMVGKEGGDPKLFMKG